MLALEREKEKGSAAGVVPLTWIDEGLPVKENERETALLSNKQKFNTLLSIWMSTVCTYSPGLDYE